MQPIYFLENVQREQVLGSSGVNRQLLNARGVGLIFDDVRPEQIAMANLTGNGPGNKPGCVIAYQTNAGAIPDRLGYFPDEIEWTRMLGCDSWIGIRKQSPPTENELRRNRVFKGYKTTLGNDQYDIAVIRRPDDSTGLPCSMRMDTAGNIVETVREQYREIWNNAADIVKWFTTGDEGFATFNKVSAMRLAVAVLSLNYRFGMDEQNAMGLLDTENYLVVLSCAIDFPAIAEIQDAKKKND